MLKDRLVAFRRRWHQEHPDFPLSIDLNNPGQTRGATRKWWDGGRDRLASLHCSEIERRNRTEHWPEPSKESIDRIEAALRADQHEPQVGDQTIPRREPQRNRRRRIIIWMLSIVGLIVGLIVVTPVIALGIGLLVDATSSSSGIIASPARRAAPILVTATETRLSRHDQAHFEPSISRPEAKPCSSVPAPMTHPAMFTSGRPDGAKICKVAGSALRESWPFPTTVS